MQVQTNRLALFYILGFFGISMIHVESTFCWIFLRRIVYSRDRHLKRSTLGRNRSSRSILVAQSILFFYASPVNWPSSINYQAFNAARRPLTAVRVVNPVYRPLIFHGQTDRMTQRQTNGLTPFCIVGFFEGSRSHMESTIRSIFC